MSCALFLSACNSKIAVDVKTGAESRTVRATKETPTATPTINPVATTAQTVLTDVDAPTPGGAGAISVSIPSTASCEVDWAKATDSVTSSDELEYQLVYSNSNNLTTVDSALANGTVAMAYTKNITHKSLSGLAPAPYYFAVIVRDQAGNKKLYNVTEGPWIGSRSQGVNNVERTSWTSESTNSYSLAIDSSSNVISVGNAGAPLDNQEAISNLGDGYVTKFDSAGVRLWSRMVGAPGVLTTVSQVTTDSTNNIYVIGTIGADLNGVAKTGTSDLFIVKYSPSGDRLWTKLIGAASGTVWPGGIVCDSLNHITVAAKTNVAVDGNNLTGVYDLLVMQFDSDGTKLWSQQLGVATKNMYPQNVSVDSTNNLYVGGSTTGGFDGNALTGVQDLFVTKFNSSGTKQWTKQLGGAGVTVNPADIESDSAGNSYIGGYVNGSIDGQAYTGTYAMFMTKYNNAGVKQWTRILGVAGAWTRGFAVAVDSNGDPYIHGTTGGNLDGQTKTGIEDLFLTKYNAAGTKQWTKLSYALMTMPFQAMASDSLGSVFAVVNSFTSINGAKTYGGFGPYIIKYSSAGVVGWTNSLGPIRNNTSYYDMTFVADKSLWVVGKTTGTITGSGLAGQFYDVLLTQYSPGGSILSNYQFGFPGVDMTAKSIAYSQTTNDMYIGGSTNGGFDGQTLIGTRDGFIAKIDTSGQRLWTKFFGAAGGTVNIVKVVSDSAGNVYAIGSTTAGLDGNSQAGSYDLFVTKYDRTGVRLWTRQLGGATGIANVYAGSIDSNGNTYVGGSINIAFDGNAKVGNYDLFITKYDSAGVKQWTRQLGAATGSATVYGLDSDSLGNIYGAGITTRGLDGNAMIGSSMDGFIVKYSASGVKQWTKQAGIAATTSQFTRVKVDSSDNFIVIGEATGAFDGNTQFGTSFNFIVSKYDAAANKLWSRQLGSTYSDTRTSGLAIDSNSNIFVQSYASKTSPIDTFDGLTLIGEPDAIITKYGWDGVKH